MLDRTLQYQILVAMQDVYPDSMLVSELPGYSPGRIFMGNLFYLQEHGLIEGGDIRQPGQCRSMVDAQITGKGLDFLMEDGGIDAILGRVEVKFTVVELAEKIMQSLEDGGIDSHSLTKVAAILDHAPQEKFKETALYCIESMGNHQCERFSEFILGTDKQD